MKSQYCILSADAARARIFAVDSATRSTGATVTRLVEVEELIHPDRRARASDKFSDSRPGSRHGGGPGGQDHGVDDRRDSHVQESDRRFAQTILEALKTNVSSMGAEHLIVAASPSMLGRLRDGGFAGTGLETTELNKDLTSLSASQLRDRLVSDGLIPDTVNG